MTGTFILKNNIDQEYKTGEISCSINHIHPDWDILIQKYEIVSYTESGEYIHLSTFEVFKKGSSIPQVFSSYSSDYKKMLWDMVFMVKNFYLNTYKPGIVLHEVKSDISFNSRVKLYQERLIGSYKVLDQKPNIILAVREDLVN